MANLDISFIPESERRLPVRQGGSTVSASKASLLWAYRTQPGFRQAAISNLAKRRMSQTIDRVGCSKVNSKTTRLVGVLSPGGKTAKMEARPYSKDYPTMKVCNVSFKVHWLCWLVDHHDVVTSNEPEALAKMAEYLDLEVSHRCGKRCCLTCGHTTMDDPDVNISRAIICHGQRLSDLCPHDPPCVKTPVKKQRVQ